MSAAAAPVYASALQRAWLHELGLEKLWLRPPASAAARTPAATPVSTPVTSPVAPPPADVLAEPASAHGATRPVAIAVASLKNPTPPSPVTAAADLAHLDLDALRAQVQACTACGLAAGRTQAVFGTGAQPASWLVVGEAPGEQEDRQGLPFVGPSGQLLDAMLASVGHSRKRDVYIANVVKCRPPGNRNPRPEEIAACRPYLLRQIALVNPDCILVVGRFAAQTLLETDAPVSALRGRVHTFKTDSGREIPLVVSYHPAYLLRSPHEKGKAWADLQLAAASIAH